MENRTIEQKTVMAESIEAMISYKPAKQNLSEKKHMVNSLTTIGKLIRSNKLSNINAQTLVSVAIELAEIEQKIIELNFIKSELIEKILY